MDNNIFNHQFLCKLLCISANHAIFEGAVKTREIILNISDLVRYTYDTRRSIVSLDEEYKAVKNYIDIHNLRGMKENVTIEKCGKNYLNVFIKHLTILPYIIEDIEKGAEDSEECLNIKYSIECGVKEIVIKKQIGSTKDEIVRTKKI